MSVSGPDPSRHLPRGNAHRGSVPSVWLKAGASVLRLFHLRRGPFVSSSSRGKRASTPIKPASSSIALNETVLRW